MGWSARAGPADRRLARDGQADVSIVCTTLFGTDISQEAEGVGEAHSFCLQHAEHRIVSLFAAPRGIPTPGQPALPSLGRRHPCVIDRLIDERRGSGEDRGDLLSTLAFARYEETGELMDHDQLRAEIITLFLNGHETVSDALGWTFYLLSKHPTSQRKLHEELATVLGGRTPTMDDLPKLKYTTMVIEESMRLYPPAWVIERDTIEADEVGGYHIPPKSTVVLSQWVTHRHRGLLGEPGGVRSGAVLAGAVGAAPPVRLLPVRRRTAPVRRQQLRDDGDDAGPGDHRPALPPGPGARAPRRAGAGHHAAPEAWHRDDPPTTPDDVGAV